MNTLLHEVTERWVGVNAKPANDTVNSNPNSGYGIRLCRDCQHFRRTFGSMHPGEQRRTSYDCAFAVDPVTGGVTTRLAHTERQVGYCGYEGRHFREKATQDEEKAA